MVILLGITVNAHFLFAQSWQPLTLHEKFNYSVDTVGLITRTLRVDSVKVVNGDSLFYLNRIVTGCDTCSDTAYRLCNQATFLGKEMVKKAGGLFWFRSPGSLVVKSFANTGQTWLYDTLNNIQAQVVQKSFEPVFGINDSIKQIQLSNGKTLLLSKSFGFIQFQESGMDYQLEGIEGRNLGQQVPLFRDISVSYTHLTLPTNREV